MGRSAGLQDFVEIKKTERLDRNNYTGMSCVIELLSSGKLESIYLWVLPREEHNTVFQFYPSSHVWPE